MAVVTNDPLDTALDQVGDLLTRRMSEASGIGERVAAALDIAALWRVVAKHALERGDSALLAIAAREYDHFIKVAVAASAVPP